MRIRIPIARASGLTTYFSLFMVVTSADDHQIASPKVWIGASAIP